MKQTNNCVGNLEKRTINNQFEIWQQIDSIHLKPYQIHFMENVILMKEFAGNNQDVEQLIYILLYEEINVIDIAIGKRYKNYFAEYLHVHTNIPRVVIGNWNHIEPTVCFHDECYNYMILCSINLACIQNLEMKCKARHDCNVYDIFFSYRCADSKIKLDYHFMITTKI